MKVIELLQEEHPVIAAIRKEKIAANKAKNSAEAKERRAAAAAFKRKLNAPEKKPAKSSMNLNQIGNWIIDAVSNAVPDGDPIDMIANKFKKAGMDTYNITPILDKAVKAHPMLKHHKSYDRYLKDMWDYYIDEVDPEFNGGKNPFK